LEDEEIIVRTIALITLVRVIHLKGRAALEESTFSKIISKNLSIIMDKVTEDEDS
jgi:hypothetical protein